MTPPDLDAIELRAKSIGLESSPAQIYQVAADVRRLAVEVRELEERITYWRFRAEGAESELEKLKALRYPLGPVSSGDVPVLPSLEDGRKR